MLRAPTTLQKGSRIDLGFDRLGWVRVLRNGPETRYEIVGTLRRRPRSCPVSAATANELMAAGLPVVLSTCAPREP